MKTRLAFILGPIAFDHSDAEVRQIIDDGFDIALSENVAVGFHVDDAMFWSKRSDLFLRRYSTVDSADQTLRLREHENPRDPLC